MLQKIILRILIFVVSIIGIFTAGHHILLTIEKDKIMPNGHLVKINDHNIHIYTNGILTDIPTLVFMSGAGTAAPVYDFKPLHSILSQEYHIAVVEKIGYGYSDIADIPRDINSMLDETRQSLKLAGVNEPYILLPHSMSGLEALYWAQKYPEEIAAIIGLDMAFPEAYKKLKINKPLLRFMGILAFFGIQRLPFIYPISNNELTTDEYTQIKYLTYRNAINKTMGNEWEIVYKNAETVDALPYPHIPVLLFSSDGSEIGDFWVSCQNDFSNRMNAKLILLNCGHYIHQFEAKRIADECKKFLNNIGEK
ncbi:alpha/beta hydrolase [Spirochaetia bacterium]|nr:alpha/beta hydrolase [Spirochaetia bacterium]